MHFANILNYTQQFMIYSVVIIPHYQYNIVKGYSLSLALIHPRVAQVTSACSKVKVHIQFLLNARVLEVVLSQRVYSFKMSKLKCYSSKTK